MNGLIHAYCLQLFVDATRHSSLLSFSMNQKRHLNWVVFVDVLFICIQHLRSSPDLVDLCSLVFYVVFCISLFVLLAITCILHVFLRSMYGVLLPLWYIDIFLKRSVQLIVRVNKTNRHNLCVAYTILEALCAKCQQLKLLYSQLYRIRQLFCNTNSYTVICGIQILF